MRTTFRRNSCVGFILQWWITITLLGCTQIQTVGFKVARPSRNSGQVALQPPTNGVLSSSTPGGALWSWWGIDKLGCMAPAPWALDASAAGREQNNTADVRYLDSKDELKKAERLERKIEQVGR